MTDPTKKDDSEKAKAVRNAMTGTPEPDAKSPPAGKPAEPAKEPPKPDAPASASAKPPEAPKEPPTEPAKPAAATPEPAKPAPAEKQPARDPARGSVPASSTPGTRPGAASGSKEPPRSPGGPPGPGGGPGSPRGPGTPSPSAADKSPPPKQPASKPKKKGGCLGTLLGLLLILVVLGVGVYYSWPYWPESVKQPVQAKIDEVVPTVQTPEEKQVLENQLAAFQQQISELESKVADLANRKVMTENDVKALVAAGGGTGGEDADLSALTKRLDALEQSLSSMAASRAPGEGDDKSAAVAAVAGTAAISATVQALSQRVEKLETDVDAVEGVRSRLSDIEKQTLGKPDGDAKAAVVLAVSNLSHAVSQSAPYESELEALKAVAKEDQAMAQPLGVLENHAASGVPSLVELRASFPEVAREVSRVHADWTGEDWADKALSRVTSLVSVRKTGTEAMAAKGTDGILAQAEAALALGDVAAAVKALQGLEGPEAEAAAPWLAKARERLNALDALAALRQAAIDRLAKGS